MKHLKTAVLLAASSAACLFVLAAAPAGEPSTAPIEQPASAKGPRPVPAPTGKPMVLDKSVTVMLAERIAKQLIVASPIANPADAKTRDLAADRLAGCKDLIDAASGKILWGGYHPKQGYNPEAYRLAEDAPLDYFQLTELAPVVWAKLYLSTFMFSGPYEIRQEGGLTVLALDAQFRGGLDPGDYPYPFWHSPNKWNMYLHSSKVLLVFEKGRLVSSMRQAPLPESLPLIDKRKWDANWTWTDAQGNPQPRVALFSYIFSKDNPHVPALDASFRDLERTFRAQNCTVCHVPNNQSKINDLLLLNYPNQALIMRRTLVTVLEANEMPPGSRTAHEPAGIQDREVLDELIKLAKEFEKKADAAMAYEQLHQPGQ